MTPEEKANNNILLVIQKIRNLQLQKSSQDIEYKIGNLLMSYEDELTILDMLEDKEVIQINESYGNDSYR